MYNQSIAELVREFEHLTTKPNSKQNLITLGTIILNYNERQEQFKYSNSKEGLLLKKENYLDCEDKLKDKLSIFSIIALPLGILSFTSLAVYALNSENTATEPLLLSSSLTTFGLGIIYALTHKEKKEFETKRRTIETRIKQLV